MPPPLQELGGLFFHGFVLTDPDRAQTQNADLPGIPIRGAIKTQNFVEGADP